MKKNEQYEKEINNKLEVIKLEKLIISFLYVAFSLSIGFIAYYNQLNISLVQIEPSKISNLQFIPYGPTFQYYFYFNIFAIISVFSGISFILFESKKTKMLLFVINLISFFITMSIFALWIYNYKDSFYYS